MAAVGCGRRGEWKHGEEPPPVQPDQAVGPAVTAQRETAHAEIDAFTLRVEREEMLFNLFGPEGVAELAALSVEQQDACCQERLAAVPTDSEVSWVTERVPGDGDCFFHALERVAHPWLPCLTRNDTTPEALRSAMADQLEHELQALNQAVGSAQDTQSLLEKTPYLAALPCASSPKQPLTPEQAKALRQVRHRGGWNDETGDLFAAIASTTFKLRVQVITPYGEQTFGQEDWPIVRLILRHGHYEPVVGAG